MSGTATQAAPTSAPSGMQRIPLPLESYQYVSKPLNHKVLLNFYAEQAHRMTAAPPRHSWQRPALSSSPTWFLAPAR